MMHSFRHRQHTEREARLCFQMNNVPAAPGAPGQNLEYYLDWAREYASWLLDVVGTEVGNVGEMIIKFAMSVPPTMLNCLEKAYATFPSRAEVVEQLSRMSNFFRDMPEIFTYFPKAEALEDIQTITNLTDHAHWIAAFRNNPDLTRRPVEQTPLPTDETFGPEALLLSLKPEERQAIYVQYVDMFIPPVIQEEMGIISDPTKSPQERFDALDERKDLLNASLGAILGVDNYDEGLQDLQEKEHAKIIAQKSLRHYYQIDKQPGIVSEGERADYAQALQYQRLAGLTVTATDPDKLMSRIGNSRFRGALMTGVIDRERLDYLAGGLKEREHEIRLSTANVRDNLNYYTEATKLEYKKEAETLRQTWDKLGGIEKLVLLGAVTYGLWKSTTVRVVAGGILAGYFFQKLVMKEEDPVKKWSALLSGISNPVKGATAATAGAELTPGYVENVATRSNVIVDFLEDFEMTHLERQAIGFGILHDMPLGTLADSFKMDGPDGQEMRLETKDPEFQKKVGDALKKRGWSRTRFDEFFDDPENREQTTEAMSYVFFLNAAKLPENRPSVQLIFEALRRCPAGTSLSIFGKVAKDRENVMPNPQDRLLFQRAHEEYVRLVNYGKELAIGSNQTLGDFISISNDLDFTSSVPIDEDIGESSPEDIPSSGSTPPNIPSSGTTPPNIPSSGSTPPNIPSSGSSVPNAPSNGFSAPNTPSSGGSGAPNIPGGGNTAPNAPSNGSSSPSAPSNGLNSPNIPGGGNVAPGAPSSGSSVDQDDE